MPVADEHLQRCHQGRKIFADWRKSWLVNVYKRRMMLWRVALTGDKASGSGDENP